MLKLQYRTPELEEKSKGENKIYLVANIGKAHQLFQGQSLSVLTGVAIKSDQHVFASPLPDLNKLGLVMGSGMEKLDTEGKEVEIVIWNRNQQGQQRMIEITPGMQIAELVVMPKYCEGLTEKSPVEKVDTGQEKPTLASLRKNCDEQGIKYKVKDTIKDLNELLAPNTARG